MIAVQDKIESLRRSAEATKQSAYRCDNARDRSDEFLLAHKLNQQADDLENGVIQWP